MSSSSKEIRFHFDSITLNNTKNIDPQVAFDKKFVYIGNANYTIKFKELNRVNVEEYSNANNYGGGGVGGYGSRFNRQHQQQSRRGGGGASTMVMTLQSRDKSFTCLTNINNNNNNNALEFNDFVEQMKVAHRKIKIKNHEKDPYANTTTTTNAGGNNNRRRGGMNNNSTRPTITPSFPRSQQQQQQQQQSSGGLHMTPTKLKKTSGAYLSSTTLNTNNRGGRYNDTTAKSNHNNNNIGSGELSRGNGHFSNNNVVNNNDGTTNGVVESPGAFLSSKSPRNATPTKLRPNNNDDTDDDDGVDEFEFEPTKGVGSGGGGGGGGGRVLFHDDVGIRERKKNRTLGGKKVNKMSMKISQQMMADRSDDEGDYDEGEEQEEVKDMVMEKEDEEEEEEEEGHGEEKKSVLKKKRLRKMVGTTTRDGESDDDATASDDDELFETSVPKSKKRLRLEDNHDEEGDELMDEKDSPSPVVNKGEKKLSEKKKNHGKTITDEDTSRETSPVTTDDVGIEVKAAVAAEGDDGKGSSSGEKTKPSSSSSSTSAKKGTIHSFFQPRSASSSSSTVDTSIKKKVAKDSDDDSSNNVPATPVKRKQVHDEDRLLTPRPPPDSSSSMQAVATPIENQRQSKYWIENNTAPKRKALSRYSDADSDNYYDFGTDEEEDDIYNDEENRLPMMKEDLDEEEENEPTTYQTTYQKRSQPFQIQNQRVKRAYGSRRNCLGTSRISNRNNNDDVRRLYGGPSEADSALMSRKNISGRTIGRDMSKRRLGPVRNPYERRPPNIIEEDQEDDKPKIPGIQNLGNTCYLSASLQTLFTLPHFLQNLYKSYEEQSFSSKKEMPLTKALLEVATIIGVLKDEDVPLINSTEAESMLANCDAANPSALKKQMDVLTDKFHGYEQRDAHEFLGDLVDFLHDELAECPDHKEKEDTTKNMFEDSDEDDGSESAAPPAAAVATPILPTDEYFHLKVRVCLECNSCGYSRSKDELYRHLSVDVGEDANEEGWSVERSLEQFFQDEERELKCEKCETGTTATQTMEIISRPKALLLHFKRFIVTQKENAEMVLRKNKVKLPLKESLSISSFFGPEEEKPDGLYHLCGVVHHVGNTAFSGHYTTCAKRKLDEESAENVEEQWVFFDDTVGERRTINYVTGNEINQKNCYMALYELK